MMSEDVLTVSVNQAAQMISLAPATIRRKVHDGVLQGTKVGRKILISLDSLKALVGAEDNAGE